MVIKVNPELSKASFDDLNDLESGRIDRVHYISQHEDLYWDSSIKCNYCNEFLILC